jgi:hypothetical protein
VHRAAGSLESPAMQRLCHARCSQSLRHSDVARALHASLDRDMRIDGPPHQPIFPIIIEIQATHYKGLNTMMLTLNMIHSSGHAKWMRPLKEVDSEGQSLLRGQWSLRPWRLL